MTDPSAEQKTEENRPAAELLPEVYAELVARYESPQGLLPGEDLVGL